MPFEQIFTLSLIQGLTEFIPVSSSAHLVLVSKVCGWKDQGFIIDVAAHVGTLGSILLYFWRDVVRLFCGVFHLLCGKWTQDAALFVNLVIATLPVVVMGAILDAYVGDALRGITVIGWASIGFGMLLWVADRGGAQTQTIANTTWGKAILFGLAQALAFIHGASRSGATITMGRFLNYTRQDATHFAFLMAIPTMMAACILKGYHLWSMGDLSLLHDAAMVAGLSCVFGVGTIACMMRWLMHHTFTPFVIYRIILGIALLTL